MRVAVLKETRPGEHRVALIPGECKSLARKGFEVAVERGAGLAAGFTDADYEEAGATLAGGPTETIAGAAVVARVSAPATGGNGLPDEIGSLPTGTVVISHLNPLVDVDTVKALADAGVTAFAMEAVPRITRAQKMDALSSQASVAGYRAALIGASELGRFLPMLTTAAGTIRPSKVLVLGAGVAGLQAIATSKRLGAVVSAFDVRPAVKEQVESLGGTFLEAELDEGAETEGGYARALSEDEHNKELDLIASHINEVDVVITTAQIPGRTAPVLVTRAMLDTMKPGSVVVDLASESGGNCEATESGKTVHHGNVKVIGPVNLPASLPVHASQMYARNVSAFLLHLAPEGELHLDFEDEITDKSCVAHGGEVRFAPAREKLGLQPLSPPAPIATPPAAEDAAIAEPSGGSDDGSSANEQGG